MIITVGAETGGVAKTRISTPIAAIAASQGVDVGLLDTDKQGSAISCCGIRNAEGVEPSIPVFALPPNPGRELVNLSSKYDLVVVDIGAQNYRTMIECALLSDLVLVPTGPDQQELESTLSVFDTFKGMTGRHIRYQEIPAFVVLARVSSIENSKVTKDIRDLFEAEGIDVFAAQIAHRAAWLATGRTGRAVHELKGKDRSQKAIDEVQGVYDEIISRNKSLEKTLAKQANV